MMAILRPLLAAAVLLSTAARAAEPVGGVAGTVTDMQGASISDATVLAHPDFAGQAGPGSQQTTAFRTDRAGKYHIELAPGFYDLCFFASAFDPQCSKIQVKAGKLLQSDRKMKVSAVVSEAIADRFFGN